MPCVKIFTLTIVFIVPRGVEIYACLTCWGIIFDVMMTTLLNNRMARKWGSLWGLGVIFESSSRSVYFYFLGGGEVIRKKICFVRGVIFSLEVAAMIGLRQAYWIRRSHKRRPLFALWLLLYMYYFGTFKVHIFFLVYIMLGAGALDTWS